jgi:hypothetical protein
VSDINLLLPHGRIVVLPEAADVDTAANLSSVEKRDHWSILVPLGERNRAIPST